MPTQRDSIYREFQSTPPDEQTGFCAKIFAQHFDAACRQQAEDSTFPTDRLKKALAALEQAVRLDAGRKDLWDTFWADMSNIFKELQAEKRRKKKELTARKQQR